MAYSKSDVEMYEGKPSVNVKVSFPFPHEMGQVIKKVREDEGGDSRFDYEFVDGTLGDDWGEQWFTSACESCFEMAQYDAEEIWSDYWNSYIVKKPELSLRGRSGGHLTVDNLPPVDEWDAVWLGRWHKFAKYARALADDVPYIMVSDIYHNVFLPWAEEWDEHAAAEKLEADEEAAALLPIEATL